MFRQPGKNYLSKKFNVQLGILHVKTSRITIISIIVIMLNYIKKLS